jgi:RimJ/RimL family protein N-acetyltransferase
LKDVTVVVYKLVKLSDGRVAILDWLKASDLPEVMNALNSVIREGKYLFVNSEIQGIKEEQKWFDCGQKQGMHYLVARVSGTVVGGASIYPRPHKSAHVVEFGIFIIKPYRNLGLGTAMTRELVETAKKCGFEIVQLSVYANNEQAFRVYKKCGFKEAGRLTNDVKFFDGTYSDRILMELLLR